MSSCDLNVNFQSHEHKVINQEPVDSRREETPEDVDVLPYLKQLKFNLTLFKTSRFHFLYHTDHSMKLCLKTRRDSTDK